VTKGLTDSKNKVPGLHDGEMSTILRSLILTQYQCVTDRETYHLCLGHALA